MITFNTLQRRFIFLLLLPVTLFLLGLGVFGYRFIQNILFKEWQEIAVLRLERAAHHMDMRLHGLMLWMQAFARAGQDPHGTEIQRWLLQQMQSEPGVSETKVTWIEPESSGAVSTPDRTATLSAIQYSYPPGGKIVGVQGDFLDQAGKPLGRLEVLVSYDYLMQGILKEGWMQTQMACLVNNEGQYLAHSNPAMQSRHCLGETQDPLELDMLMAMKEKPFATLVQGGYTPEHVIGYYKLQSAPWAIMLHARGSQILAPMLRFRLYYLLGGLVCLTGILVLIRLALKPVVTAIRDMAVKAESVAQGEYGEPLSVVSCDEIGQLNTSFNRMVVGLKERDFISNTFGRYVDQEIARDLLSRPEASRMGGEKREVVILFSDVRGFTPLAESLSPEVIIHLVNRHFSKMIEVIQEHRGIIVDFLGDAILAFFDPLEGPLEPAVGRSIGCALKMQEAVKAENLAEPGYPPLQIGIGLHAGEVVVGNIGSLKRAKYGIIGSPVNLTHRIQGQAQAGEVMISEAVLHRSPELLSVRRTFETHLKGIAHPVTLYAVEDMRGTCAKDK